MAEGNQQNRQVGTASEAKKYTTGDVGHILRMVLV